MPKSSQTSLTRFSAESGADTRERNRLLRRGSLTHVSDFTAQSPCSPCTFRKRKTRFCESENGKQGFAKASLRAVGGSIRREQGVKMHFHPLQPPSNHCATVVWLFSWCGKLASIGNAAPSLSAIKLLILRFLHLVQKCLFQTSRLPRLNVF